MVKPRITVITATVGELWELADCMQSVANQTIPTPHIVVSDGVFESRYHDLIAAIPTMSKIKLIELPFSTGKDGYYGHRIYAAFSLLVDTEFVAFLDADCTIEPDWAEKMLAHADANPDKIITCRRNLIYEDEVLGVDNRESIGANEFGYHLHDVNTYLFPTKHMVNITRLLYDKWGMDRRLAFALQDNIYHTTEPLVNYAVREDRLDFYSMIVK
jgi:GT2 family glycosyltransferase